MNSTNIPDTLLSLAPSDLGSHRPELFDGGGFNVSLEQLTVIDHTFYAWFHWPACLAVSEAEAV